MSGFILTVLGSAAVIAIIFYCMGLAVARREKGREFSSYKIKQLEDAIEHATEVLKAERKTIEYHALREKELESTIDSVLTACGSIAQLQIETRADIVALREQLDYKLFDIKLYSDNRVQLQEIYTATVEQLPDFDSEAQSEKENKLYEFYRNQEQQRDKDNERHVEWWRDHFVENAVQELKDIYEIELVKQ